LYISYYKTDNPEKDGLLYIWTHKSGICACGNFQAGGAEKKKMKDFAKNAG
jgi:hypothetical protein